MEVQLYYGTFLPGHCPKKGITKLREEINIHLLIQQKHVHSLPVPGTWICTSPVEPFVVTLDIGRCERAFIGGSEISTTLHVKM